MGVDAEERLGLDTLLGDSIESERRELVFKADIASLLASDLTIESIGRQALQLLRGLTFFRRQDEKVENAPSFPIDLELMFN